MREVRLAQPLGQNADHVWGRARLTRKRNTAVSLEKNKSNVKRLLAEKLRKVILFSLIDDREAGSSWNI